MMRKLLRFTLIFFSLLVVLGITFYFQVTSKSIREFDTVSPFHQNNFKELRFAHRGGYAYGPENTIETITKNIREHDINALEVDVHMTKDGDLILFHDETVSRILQSGDHRTVLEYETSELLSIPLRDTTLGVVYTPLLESVIDTLKSLILKEDRKFMIELDFKPHGENTKESVSELIRIIEKEEAELGEGIYDFFFVSTFYPDVLAELRRQSKKLVIGFGVHSDPSENVFMARLGVLLADFFIKKNDVSILEPNHCLVTDRFVEKWLERKVLINTYTLNTACEKEYINELPIAYTTNCPLQDCNHDVSDQLSKARNWCTNCY